MMILKSILIIFFRDRPALTETANGFVKFMSLTQLRGVVAHW